MLSAGELAGAAQAGRRGGLERNTEGWSMRTVPGQRARARGRSQLGKGSEEAMMKPGPERRQWRARPAPVRAPQCLSERGRA